MRDILEVQLAHAPAASLSGVDPGLCLDGEEPPTPLMRYFSHRSLPLRGGEKKHLVTMQQLDRSAAGFTLRIAMSVGALEALVAADLVSERTLAGQRGRARHLQCYRLMN